jgi:hypothetical protein
MSSNEESKEDEGPRSNRLSNSRVIAPPVLEEVMVPQKKVPSARHKDLRSETEKAEDLE